MKTTSTRNLIPQCTLCCSAEDNSRYVSEWLYQWNLDSKFRIQLLAGFLIPWAEFRSPGFRIPRAKFFRIALRGARDQQAVLFNRAKLKNPNLCLELCRITVIVGIGTLMHQVHGAESEPWLYRGILYFRKCVLSYFAFVHISSFVYKRFPCCNNQDFLF